MGKLIATDVHVLSNPGDAYNREFMEAADILFFSDEQIPCALEEFICILKERCSSRIIFMGRGDKGTMLYAFLPWRYCCAQRCSWQKKIGSNSASEGFCSEREVERRFKEQHIEVIRVGRDA